MTFFTSFLHRQFIYTPPVPNTSFKDKTIIVTGGNAGLGKEAVQLLVRLGASQVIIACRSVEKGEAAAKDIQASTTCSSDTIKVWELDMSSQDSVKSFCKRANAELSRLDVLIANAGLRATTFRSIEVTASELYELAKFPERNAPKGKIFATLNDESKADMKDRYNTSKLLEMFVIKHMATVYPLEKENVIVNCVAPGFCDTGLTREHDSFALRIIKFILCRSAEVGGRTLVLGACAGPQSHGQYVPDGKITEMRGLIAAQEGAELQERIWTELKEILEAIQPGVTSFA